MKRTSLIAFLMLAFSVALLAAPRFWDAPAPGYQNWNFPPEEKLERARAYLKNATDVSFEGEIVAIAFERPAVLKVETDDGTREVLLHPLWRLAGVELSMGQKILVEGKLIQKAGEEYVLPLKVTVGEKTVDFTQYLAKLKNKIAQLRTRTFRPYGYRCPCWGYPGYGAPRLRPPARTPGYRW
ncbi:MAG: hypothetical protein PWP37_1401 [Thermotogota bacterium]|nr:hypothetical protein [Thermotogota bacterium]MDK2865209.1 hypothetical protein [Thermotogota bacterium]